MAGDFYPAAQTIQNPDILGAYIRGQMAPLQVQAAQQGVQAGALQLNQLKLALQGQQMTQNLARQIAGGYPGQAAQNQEGASGDIQSGPQGLVGPPSAPPVNTLMALDVLQGRDPLSSAKSAQDYEIKQRQMQVQGPMAMAETVSSSPNADVLIKNNPSLQQAWINTAPKLGLDPFKDLTPENARRAAIFGYNNLAGSAGLPPKAMPVTMEQINGPNGQRLSRNPLTGEVKQEVGEESLHPVIGSNGQPVLLPASQAVGKQPFNQSLFGAANISDQTKEFAYQKYLTTGKLDVNVARSPAAQSQLWNYIAQRADQDGNSAASISARGQAFQASQGVVKDFTSGQTSKTLNGLNTAIGHMDQLDQAATALNNGNIQALNKMSNFFGTQFGSSNVTNFNVIKNFAAGEVAKAVLPGGGGEREREEIADAIKNSNSPQQLHDAISTWRNLLSSKTEALRNQWDVGTNGTQGSFDKFLLPDTKKALGIQSATGNAPPAAIAYLKQHPEAAEQFKAKYGYVPQ